MLGSMHWWNEFEDRALGVSREKAAENRRAIVAAASQLFRERGVDAVGLNELMKQAGFTQGGFYNHFKFEGRPGRGSACFGDGRGRRRPRQEHQIARRRIKHRSSALHKLVFVAGPSRQHRSRLPCRRICWRCSPPGRRSTVAFPGGLDDQITILAGLIAESGSLAASGERRTLRERAMSLHCEMVGALVLSRSVAQVAPALSNEILENVHRDVLASLNDRSIQSPKLHKKL